MKIYISADIEGITGVTSWSETEIGKEGYSYFAKQMTAEVNAACIGALKAGADEIIVKDAHDSARNIDAAMLPKECKVIRGWSGHPFSMVDRLDSSYDAAIFIGYHSFSGSSGNPLSHTMNPFLINYIKINGEYASEFLINSYAAAYVKVPVVFVSGDNALTRTINNKFPFIKTLGVKEGIGGSTFSIHPEESKVLTEELVYESLKSDNRRILKLPESFNVEMDFINHYKAYRASFYPGMEMLTDTSLVFKTEDYFKVLAMIAFVL